MAKAKSNKKSIILGVTGSIAAYKAAEIARSLCRLGFEVEVIMTEEAQKFIAPLTFHHLTRRPVITDMFSLPDVKDPAHISLADKAGLIIIAPATANIIGKLANGICDCILSCTVISTKAKVLIAPAMNKNMYENKIVQANIAKLKSVGVEFIGPIKGKLVCGSSGMGHIADVEDIVSRAKQLLNTDKHRFAPRNTDVHR